MPNHKPNAARPDSPDDIAAAYAQIEPELAKIPARADRARQRGHPERRLHRLGRASGHSGAGARHEGGLQKPPTEEIERLRVRALGLLYTHLRYVPRSSQQLEADLEEGRVLRAQLLTVADAHVSFGVMNADAVAAIRDGAGHLDRANDLIALAALFRASWDDIKGKTMVTEEQIDRASTLGTQLVAELGAKTIGAGTVAPGTTWADQRNRAFRLFVFDYTEIQRAVVYLRYHEGDADAIAPSIHSGRTHHRSSAAQDAGANNRARPPPARGTRPPGVPAPPLSTPRRAAAAPMARATRGRPTDAMPGRSAPKPGERSSSHELPPPNPAERSSSYELPPPNRGALVLP